MNLSYDSVLGIPTVQLDGINNNNNNNNNTSNSGLNLGMSSVLFLALIILMFIVLFSSLGKKGETISAGENGGNGSTKLLTIIMGGVLIVVVVLNGLQYFFNINLTARLDNIFTDTPSIDLTVQQETSGPDEIAPVPEIKLKEQVFHVPGNKYTYDDAGAMCKAYGGRLATYSEVENSYKNGAEWCSYGWSDRQLALFPTQKDTWNYLQNVEGHENDCGRAGINGGYIANPNVRFGANCYGYKPKATDEELEKMNTEPLYPRTMNDIKEEKRIDFWRRRIPEILVAPFNKNVWSLL